MKINTTHFNRKKNWSVYFYQGYIYCTNIYLSPCFLHDVMNLWYIRQEWRVPLLTVYLFMMTTFKIFMGFFCEHNKHK